ALGGIAERQQKALVAARQCLQAQVALHRKCPWFAGQIARFVTVRQRAVFLDHAVDAENIGYTRRFFGFCGAQFRFRHSHIASQIGIKQPMGIIEGRPQKLATRQILIGRRNAALNQHLCRFHRTGIAEARQGGAIGAHQKDCFDQIATRLTHGKGCQFTVIERTFRHDAINRQRQLFGNLVEAKRWNRTVTATTIIEKTVGIADGRFATLYGNIHFQPSRAEILVVRGSAATAPSQTRTRSTPSGYCAPFSRHCWMKSWGRPSTWSERSPSMPGPFSTKPCPLFSDATASTMVVERSGNSALPCEKSARDGSRDTSLTRANCAASAFSPPAARAGKVSQAVASSLAAIAASHHTVASWSSRVAEITPSSGVNGCGGVAAAASG